MCHRACVNELNIVKDFDVLQGYKDFGKIPMRYNIDVKRVRVGNNSNIPVLAAIHTCQFGQAPKPQFLLEPGKPINLGLNPAGDHHQFIWLFDHKTRMVIADPHIIHRQVNSLVINKGVNRWWIMDYREPSYRAY